MSLLQLTIPVNHVEKLVCYFENMYKNTDSLDLNSSMGIEDFLGEDIASHPLVINSKLSENEYVALDAPLSLVELDKSVENVILNLRLVLMVLVTPSLNDIGNFSMYRYLIMPHAVMIKVA
jgi:hypothetical protein